MEHLLRKYLSKLESQGLASKESAIFLGLDAELVSNQPIEGDVLKLSRVFDLMNINTLLFSEPIEPYKSIIKELCRAHSAEDKEKEGQGLHSEIGTLSKIVPMDCEMRTFFHDVPIIDDFSPEAIAQALSRRKSAIIRDRGIVTYGAVAPEQAFVSFSSVCFSTFVKYFYDSLVRFERLHAGNESPDREFVEGCERITRHLLETKPNNLSSPSCTIPLRSGLPKDEDDVIAMISEAGRAVVECGLVDSFFGNISYVHSGVMYISQTSSSLDELDHCIDAVPLDGSSSAGITASSELSAHKNIYYETGDNAILHGHPKFSVIMSMHCLKEGCNRDLCHKSCREEREISGIPIVSGEVGTGPTGLMHTVPLAMKKGKGAIVYGHGVFTSSRKDFQEPFDRLLDIENRCREAYFRLVGRYSP